MTYLRVVSICTVFAGFGAIGVACGDDAGSDGSGGSGATNVGGNPTTTVTSSVTASVSTSSTSTTGGGNTFIDCSGAGQEYSNIPVGECDLLQQDCPGGQTCRPVNDAGNWTTRCLNAGLKDIGADCQTDSECSAGLLCGVGQCVPVCCDGSPGDVPCNGGTCNLQLTVSPGDNLYMYLCTYAQQCTAFDYMSCPDGEDCHLEQQGIMSCFPPSGANLTEGEVCNFVNDCPSMQQCNNEGGTGYCRWFCDLQPNMSAVGEGGCPAGQTCSFSGTGITDLGICEPT